MLAVSVPLYLLFDSFKQSSLFLPHNGPTPVNPVPDSSPPIDDDLNVHGSIASASYDCSSAGIAILKRGGNAVDAAVTVALCLDVVNSFATTIGSGGGMMYT